MTQLIFRTVDGGRATIDQDMLQTLAASLGGDTVAPGSDDYESTRQIWNAMIDRRPALIVRCAGTADVLASVRFARDHRLLTSIRGAGHNIAGNAVCDGGLMIDLTAMRSVRVDPWARRAHVEPGARLADLDRETQAFGLATPLGINSTTGVAGLTLGGGFGWLSRKHGLSVDNLASADLVTARGELVRASEDEHPDLFWAIRGGGGNFGVVTSFEFRLHPVGPEILAGLIVHPLAGAKELLQHVRDLAEACPDELSCWPVLRQAPPLPFLPAEAHGQPVLVLALCHAGDPATARRAIEPILALGEPLGSHLGPIAYAGWQAAFDPLLTPGARNYWKSHNFRRLPDEAIDLLVREAAQLPTSECEIFLGQLGGAVNRVPAEATAYPHRDACYVMNVHARWQDPADDASCVAWARRVFEATAPFATGGAYVNFLTEEEARPEAAWGANFGRLLAVKRRYDPDNLFRVNQNISLPMAA